jgi:bifunctional non-homologous end joining protein LigD
MPQKRASAAAEPRTAKRSSQAGTTARTRLLRSLDAEPSDLTLDVDGDAVAVTNLERVYWPAAPPLQRGAVTKRDFLRYLVRVADAMLPHLRDRPLTLFRWPEGVAGRRVLMKHWEIRLPAFVERVNVFSESKGQPDQYILCNNLATLVWLGHMGTLEFHAWHSRIVTGADAPGAGADFAASLEALHASVLERPDYLLFDIDPFIYSGRETRAKQPEFSEEAFERSREVAAWLKETLDGMRLDSFVKTSGKTGLHVVVPIRRSLRYEAVREVARFIGEHLARAHRDAITVDWSVERRTGKVFIDYNMNVRGKSMTAPYSPRGLAGAPVSMPIRWDALPRVDPLQFTLATLPRAIRSDPWRGLAKASQSLEQRLAASRG